MADLGIWTKNALIQARAGVNANTTSKATAATDVYVLQLEATVNSITKFNWSDAVTAGLNADVQGLLEETTSCMGAINVINADMSGFTSRLEAGTMIDVLNDIVKRNLNELSKQEVQDFINGA